MPAAPCELCAVSSAPIAASVPSLVPSSHQHQGTLPALNIQFPSPSPPCDRVQHRNEPVGPPVPCAGAGGDTRLGGCCVPACCRGGWEQRRGEPRPPPHSQAMALGTRVTFLPLPAGHASACCNAGFSSPCISPPGLGSGQELLPLPYPCSSSPLEGQLACSLRGVAC